MVKYDGKYHNVMQKLFADWFLCETEDQARKISAKGKFGFNCITKKGDIYRADGTLSGGDTTRSGGNRLLEI